MGVGRPEVVIELGLPKVVRRGPTWADVGRRGPKKLSEKKGGVGNPQSYFERII